jgi:Xaa-Pro aminopeptidase
MKYNYIDKNLFVNNRAKLINGIKPNSLIIVNSNDEMPRNGDQFFKFRQNSDLFYLTGLDQEKCILCICPDHPLEPNREVVFTMKTNETMVTWFGHKYSKEAVTETSGVQTVMWLDEFENYLKEYMSRVENVYLNLNENPRFSTEVPLKDFRFANKIKNDFPLHNYERLAPVMTELRLVKEPEEIALMSKACEITEKAFRRVLKFLKPGVMEYELEAEITHEFLMNRASGHSYSPIVASGINACILHYEENNKECKDGDLVLLDFGAEYANYAGDCSRTIPVNGKFSPRQKDCYNAVLRVMKYAKSLLVPGTTIDIYHKEVCKFMEKELIGLGLITGEDLEKQDKDKPLYFKYYMHGTSHFMGLDVHDVGTKQHILKKGMVLSCEPGIYIPEENIGIRIENDIMVDDVPVDLMNNIPIEVEEIEAIMNEGKLLSNE